MEIIWGRICALIILMMKCCIYLFVFLCVCMYLFISVYFTCVFHFCVEQIPCIGVCIQVWVLCIYKCVFICVCLCLCISVSFVGKSFSSCSIFFTDSVSNWYTKSSFSCSQVEINQKQSNNKQNKKKNKNRMPFALKLFILIV